MGSKSETNPTSIPNWLHGDQPAVQGSPIPISPTMIGPPALIETDTHASARILRPL